MLKVDRAEVGDRNFKSEGYYNIRMRFPLHWSVWKIPLRWHQSNLNSQFYAFKLNLGSCLLRRQLGWRWYSANMRNMKILKIVNNKSIPCMKYEFLKLTKTAFDFIGLFFTLKFRLTECIKVENLLNDR